MKLSPRWQDYSLLYVLQSHPMFHHLSLRKKTSTTQQGQWPCLVHISKFNALTLLFSRRAICTGSLETSPASILWEKDKQTPLPCWLLNKELNSGTREASGASNLVHFITMVQLSFSFWDVKTQHSSGQACLAMKPFWSEVCEGRQVRTTPMVLVVVSVVEHSKAYSVPWVHMVHWAVVGKTGHEHPDGHSSQVNSTGMDGYSPPVPFGHHRTHSLARAHYNCSMWTWRS